MEKGRQKPILQAEVDTGSADIEGLFAAQIRSIPGCDMEKLSGWLDIAREFSDGDGDDYRLLLREFGEAFEQIAEGDAETAAALFNYPARYLPVELFTAAEWVGNGAGAEEAYEAFSAQSELNEIHHKHMLWKRGDPDGTRADFSGRVLKNLNFEGKHFDGARFTNARLENCWMNDTRFTNSDFTGASFEFVSAIGSDFDSAVFDGAALAKSSFEATYLGGASFVGTALTGCDFHDADTEGADFSRASVQDCRGLDEVLLDPGMIM